MHCVPSWKTSIQFLYGPAALFWWYFAPGTNIILHIKAVYTAIKHQPSLLLLCGFFNCHYVKTVSYSLMRYRTTDRLSKQRPLRLSGGINVHNLSHAMWLQRGNNILWMHKHNPALVGPHWRFMRVQHLSQFVTKERKQLCYLWFCLAQVYRTQFLRCSQTSSSAPPGSCSEADSWLSS